MALYQSVAETIGNTPLVKISNFEKAYGLEANVYAKLEYFNPAGSVKDRVAKAIIDDAVATGKLKEGATIIEPTSGNTGIGIASYAAAKGFKVIIAGAGMAAHLPGMCAAIFPMPVIGIPMSGKNLEGVDALYSIVQMPPGIPVATVAIDGGANAAILAAKILATSDPELLQKLKDYTAEMKETVQKKAEKLEKIGHKEYIKQM